MRIIYESVEFGRRNWLLVFDNRDEADTTKKILEDLIADKNAKERARGD